MTVTTEAVEEIRELLLSHQLAHLHSSKMNAVSMAAAVELACCRAEWRGDRVITEVFNTWESQSPVLALAFTTLELGVIPARRRIFDSRRYEFFPIAGCRWDDNEHHLFESRFTKSLRESGFADNATALAGGERPAFS